MQVTLDIPEVLASKFVATGKDPARATLEALALEGYRSHELSEAQVRRMLGFETRMEVHAFLKQHGVVLNYTLAELDRDRQASGTLSTHAALQGTAV